jgi:hypothetical protein
MRNSLVRCWRGRITGILAYALLFAGIVAHGSEYHELVTLFDEFRAAKELQPVNGVVDYSAEAVAKRQEQLRQLQARFNQLKVDDWDRAQKVDYLAVRAQMDQQDFILSVARPWARDPGMYVDPLLKIAFTEVPVKGNDLKKLRDDLRAVPRQLAAAKRNLTEVAGDFADFAIHNLKHSDGVNLRHPYREIPPAGVLGWYDDLLGRARTRQPELVKDIVAAKTAIESFHDWLVANRSSMTAQAGVGKELFDWYMRSVKLMPYTGDEVLTLAQRELERNLAFYALERHRNRDLPELTFPKTREEYHERMAKMDAEVREFLVKDEFITIPDYIPTDWQEMGFNALWLVRAGGPNFWESVLYRDPNPDHWHAVIPGHRFDGMVAQRSTHPIRRYVSDPGRGEGWALYLEEAPLQLGFYEKYQRPRAREFIYVFGIFRAVRTIADVRMQRNEMNALETAAYWKKWTPWLDDNVSRVDAEIYRRRPPGYGLSYTIGSFQMHKLLGERRHQLGDAFNLKEFHDWIMNAGRLPISLLRFELTGYDDEVKALWEHRPLSTVRR